MESVLLLFSLLVSAADTIKLCGPRLRISHLSIVPQKNLRNWLICESTAPPPGGDSSPPPSISAITTSLISFLRQLSMSVPINPWHQPPCSSVLAFPVSSRKYGMWAHPMARSSFPNGVSQIPFIDSLLGQKMWWPLHVWCLPYLRMRRPFFVWNC